MAKYVYHRIAGYVITIALLGGNIMYIRQHKPAEVMKDVRVQFFFEISNRFLTLWTNYNHIIYAVVGLVCELFTLKNSYKKDYQPPKYVRVFRDTLFTSILWPSVLVVFSMFWAIFLYDKQLVYPDFLDQFMHPLSNHIMHTIILPLVLWEVWFQPKTQPRSHKGYLGLGIAYFFLYLFVLLYTYYEKGVWIYPILKEVYGTIYFPILVVFTAIISIIFYFSHWGLVHLLWSKSEKPKKSPVKKIR